MGRPFPPFPLDLLGPETLGLPGRLALGFAPGRQAGRWETRDLEVDLGSLRKDHGLDRLVCLVQHNTGRALGLVGLYIATALTRSTLEPRLVGRQLGLDPLVTLIALYVGFRLWGLPGMILSPLLVITLISMFPQVQAGQQ